MTDSSSPPCLSRMASRHGGGAAGCPCSPRPAATATNQSPLMSTLPPCPPDVYAVPPPPPQSPLVPRPPPHPLLPALPWPGQYSHGTQDLGHTVVSKHGEGGHVTERVGGPRGRESLADYFDKLAQPFRTKNKIAKHSKKQCSWY